MRTPRDFSRTPGWEPLVYNLIRFFDNDCHNVHINVVEN